MRNATTFRHEYLHHYKPQVAIITSLTSPRTHVLVILWYEAKRTRLYKKSHVWSSPGACAVVSRAFSGQNAGIWMSRYRDQYIEVKRTRFLYESGKGLVLLQPISTFAAEGIFLKKKKLSRRRHSYRVVNTRQNYSTYWEVGTFDVWCCSRYNSLWWIVRESILNDRRRPLNRIGNNVFVGAAAADIASASVIAMVFSEMQRAKRFL